MSVRVVLDTNCIVSALLFSKHRMSWLRQCWQSGGIVPLVSKATVTELLDVFNYPKFKLDKAEQTLLLADFLPYAQTVTGFKTPAGLPELRDPADRMFLILAVAGKADAVVTGDKDLLAVKQSFKGPPIMTIDEFERWLRQNNIPTANT